MIDVINDKVVDQIKSSARTVAAWDFLTALGDTVREKLESLVLRFEDMSAMIYCKTKQGRAEWIIMPEMTAELVVTELIGESVSKFMGRLFGRKVYESLSISDRVIAPSNRYQSWRGFSNYTALHI